MAEQSFPYDAGAGATISEADWQRMARRFLNTGVIAGDLDQLAVSADGLTRSVTVATGHAFIEGFFYRNDAAKNIPLDAADATNPRIDRIVVRMDRTANTAVAQFVKGTPAASPTAPALTLTDTVFDLLLADVTVPATAGVIVAENVTDRRTLVRNLTEAAASAAYVAKARTVIRAAVTTNQTGVVAEVDLNGLTVGIGSSPGLEAGRRLRVMASLHIFSSVAQDSFSVRLYQDGVRVGSGEGQVVTANNQIPVTFFVDVTPTAGAHTWKLTLIRTSGTGGLALFASASVPATLLVEDIGAAA